jgi:mannose-6-phosphate isomerase-like protein (cupin superfamily)
MINIEDLKAIVKQSKAEEKIVFLSDAFKDTPDWELFYNIFKLALGKNAADLSAPSTLTIDNSEKYTEGFDSLVSTLINAHPGQKIAVLSIIHFMNSHNNDVPDAAQAFYRDFIEANPNKLPPGFDYSLFQPTIHSDPVDGFYIQCEGQTTWRAFYKDRTESYLVNPGDLLYIPNGINHSVESMNVRAAISVSFFDEE